MQKKIFILALGVFLVMAFSMTAIAETKVSFSGTYRVRAWYKNNFNSADDSDLESKSSYWDHRLRINMNFMPSDALALRMQMNWDGNRWGKQTWSTSYARGGVGNNHNDGGMEVRYLYMDIKTGVGSFALGRMPGGAEGLQSLGYTGSSFWAHEYADGVGPRDRVRYSYTSGPFALAAFYDKRVEYDDATGTAAPPNKFYDNDWDDYAIRGIYNFANGGADLTLIYRRNFSNDNTGNNPGGMLGLLPAAAVAGGAQNVDATVYILNPALVLNFGPVGIHTELRYMNGEGDINYGGATPAGLKDSVDFEGLGFYLDVTYNYGPGVVGVWYNYQTGDENATDWKVENMVATGADFVPLIIAYDQAITPQWAGSQGVFDAGNHWTIGLWWDHSITEDLMIHAAYGYLRINEAGKDPAGEDIDDDFGQEIDIALKYNIMSNLSYQVDFGYFMPGDYFKGGSNNATDGTSYVLKQTLQLSF